MRRLPALLSVVVLLATAAAARAQEPEPLPPGAEPAPPGGGPMKIEAAPPHELGKYQLGVRARYIWVTKLMLSPYFDANTGTQLNSWSVGMEFTYRPTAKHYDVVTSLDFAWLSVDDGNYLGSGHDPALDTHYTQFKNLSFVSIDVSIIGWHRFNKWLELRYGGGLGIGYVPGDVLITTNANCTAANANNPAQCFPRVTGPINGKPTDQQEAALKASEGGGTDTADTPHRHSGDKPPVMGVLNVLVGLRFYPTEHVGITYELGFRDTFFTGLSVNYLF